MIEAVESYLALQRAAGFSLSDTEYLLRSYARFARERKELFVRTATAIEWACHSPSIAQRHTRYQTAAGSASTFDWKSHGTNSHRITILAIGKHAVFRTFTLQPRSNV